MANNIIEKSLRKKFSLEQILKAATSLQVFPTPAETVKYERGVCELIGRLLLDEGGIGEGTGENAELIEEYLREAAKHTDWYEWLNEDLKRLAAKNSQS